MGRRVDIPVEAWGATTTENAMVMANFVSEMSNGSLFFPGGRRGFCMSKVLSGKGGKPTHLQFNRIKLVPKLA